MYYQFYLYLRGGQIIVPFAFYQLFQQYIINVQALYNQLTLNQIYFNQKQLYIDIYSRVIDAITYNNIDIAALSYQIILLSSFLSRLWFTRQCYQDSIVIVQKLGYLSLFIIFIANLQWLEILQELYKGETGLNQLDLVVYIFYIKVYKLLQDLYQWQIFSHFLGCVQTIKYQKRGLPHLYLLLFLYPNNREQYLNPANVN